MALLPSAKIAELPLHSSLTLCSRQLSLSLSLLRCRFRRLLFSAVASSSIHLAEHGGGDSEAQRSSRHRTPPREDDDDDDDDDRNLSSTSKSPIRSRLPSAPWLQQWDPPETSASHAPAESNPTKFEVGLGGSMERIVYRLRNLELDSEEEVDMNGDGKKLPWSGNERSSKLLGRSWSHPHSQQIADRILLPWEREDNRRFLEEEDSKSAKRKRVKAPTLAELTIEDSTLGRLRRMGIMLRERITVPKAGVTQAITEKIHDAWRKSEIVRLKFHEDLVHDMKTAHELVESRTGGLVIWRSGSIMVVYRGSNYKPPSRTQLSDVENNQTLVSNETESLFIRDVSETTTLGENVDCVISLKPETSCPSDLNIEHDVNLTEVEVEFNNLLDGLGPRFTNWWGTGILPVDADLLPQDIPGFRTPFRLLPTGMRAQLTNSEMTNLRKLTKKLPCHFALGRNRHHHGLASAILKLWEKCLVVKIAVKQGVQNTNNKLMAEELKAQTKKARAEKLLAKIEASMVPVNPCEDQETITDEERSVFRRIGLQMKAYLPLGIGGVFDGVIENMHLHWKHRELVKLISKQKTLAFVEDTARLLEYESGGILVAIEPVPKGFALVYFRGKNYKRPISLRPRHLLTKAKALKRAVAIQRHEGISEKVEIVNIDKNTIQYDDKSSLQLEDEDGSLDSEDDASDICDSGEEEDDED